MLFMIAGGAWFMVYGSDIFFSGIASTGFIFLLHGFFVEFLYFIFSVVFVPLYLLLLDHFH
jgi:hypothetical protein